MADTLPRYQEIKWEDRPLSIESKPVTANELYPLPDDKVQNAVKKHDSEFDTPKDRKLGPPKTQILTVMFARKELSDAQTEDKKE